MVQPTPQLYPDTIVICSYPRGAPLSTIYVMVDDPKTFTNVDGITPLAVESRMSIHDNALCVPWLPIEVLVPAPAIVGARRIDEHHVQDLATGFQNTFDVNDRGMLLILNTECWNRCFGQDSNGQTWAQVRKYCLDEGIELPIIGGTQTNKALRLMKAMHLDNPLWWRQKFKVLVCQDIPKVRQMLTT